MNIDPNLYPDQREAVLKMAEFLEKPTLGSSFFTLQGYAGTGKTRCMHSMYQLFKDSKTKILYSAPTNKAAKVLRTHTKEAETIYKILNLRVDTTGELKTIVGTGKPDHLTEVDAIVLDEASMVNRQLHTALSENSEKYGLKIIFVGDKAQLPPVKEKQSVVWERPADVSLEVVRRHDNAILRFATEVREQVFSNFPCITVTGDHTETEGVKKHSKQSFHNSILDAADSGVFIDGSTKIISWRNAKVTAYNDIVRGAIHGAISQTERWLPGDQIVAGAPCQRGDNLLMSTDEEAVIQAVIPCKHPTEAQYQAYELKAVTEMGKTVRLIVQHPATQAKFENDLQEIAHQAASNGKLWRTFHQKKELFHDIRHGYALTAHRAQGSTWQQCFVDTQDILSNRFNRTEAFQCLYVASTRPSRWLHLL